MDKIYKYTSLNSAIKILENNAVALNNPQNYNDPFDSVIDFDDGIEICLTVGLEPEAHVAGASLRVEFGEGSLGCRHQIHCAIVRLQCVDAGFAKVLADTALITLLKNAALVIEQMVRQYDIGGNIYQSHVGNAV